jgi:sarcosine oxidase subunit gamma
MADAALEYRSALAGVATPDRIGRADVRCSVSLRIVERVAIVSVIARKGQAGDVAARLGAIVGAPVEDRAARWSSGTLSVIGTGPYQWLVVEQGRDPARLARLRDDLVGRAAVSEQGDGRVVIEVAGPDARCTLAKGVQVDLHPDAFKVGSAASCAASHIGLVLSLIDDRPTFQIITAASTAASFWSWLSSSAGEFATEVVR